MPTVRSQFDSLAARFAEQIIAALQGASLHEIVGSMRAEEIRSALGMLPRRCRAF
jgi:hypothetical protein